MNLSDLPADVIRKIIRVGQEHIDTKFMVC